MLHGDGLRSPHELHPAAQAVLTDTGAGAGRGRGAPPAAGAHRDARRRGAPDWRALELQAEVLGRALRSRPSEAAQKGSARRRDRVYYLRRAGSIAYEARSNRASWQQRERQSHVRALGGHCCQKMPGHSIARPLPSASPAARSSAERRLSRSAFCWLELNTCKQGPDLVDVL